MQGTRAWAESRIFEGNRIDVDLEPQPVRWST